MAPAFTPRPCASRYVRAQGTVESPDGASLHSPVRIHGAMSSPSSTCTVSRLAELSGVTVRTLHHYDEIGRVPAPRDAAGHRRYGRAGLERLQEVLFYVSLDLPLAEIARLLGAARHDRLTALRDHRRRMEERRDTLGRVLETVNRSIQQEEGCRPRSGSA